MIELSHLYIARLRERAAQLKESRRRNARQRDVIDSRAIINACRRWHWRDKFPRVNMPTPEARPSGASAVRLSAEAALHVPCDVIRT